MQILHSQAARRVASVAAVIGLAGLYSLIAFGAPGGVVLAQESPLPTPEAFIATNYVYLPIIMKHKSSLPEYEPPDTPVVLACSDDQCLRGDLYRNMVSNTIVIVNPMAGWASSGCSCGLLDARARGGAIGTIIGMGFTIVGNVFSVIGNMIGNAVSLLLAMLGVVDAPPSAYSISCTADAENICIGIALIVSLDEMSGGWVTVVVTLLVGVLTFYLGQHVIKEIRSILDPQAGGE